MACPVKCLYDISNDVINDIFIDIFLAMSTGISVDIDMDNPHTSSFLGQHSYYVGCVGCVSLRAFGS